MTSAVASNAPKTMAVTQSARFCEQTATPFLVCLPPPLLSPPRKLNQRYNYMQKIVLRYKQKDAGR